MDNVNIIFLTNKAADLTFFKALSHLKEYLIAIDEIKKCYLIENFAFTEFPGNIRLYDELLESNEKSIKNKTWHIVDEIKNKVFNATLRKTILAVHWGEKDKDALKLFLEKLNKENKEKNDVIFSYWGSQSDTYGSNNLDLIVKEIIDWTNESSENKITELLETIEIHIKATGRYNGKEIDPKRIDRVNEEFDNIFAKIETLKKKFLSDQR